MIRKFVLSTLLILLVTDTSESGGTRELIIATASSLIVPLEQISKKFEENYDVEIKLVSSSSGVLTAQIRHGAPFQLFISADMSYPKAIHDMNLTYGPPMIITLGTLAVWSKSPFSDQGIDHDIQSRSPGKIAVANPDLAPFGEAAVIWMNEHNLYEQLKPHLVYGENVGQVNRMIHSGAVDIALTAASALYAPELEHTGYWSTLPYPEYPGIPHGAVLIKLPGAKVTPEAHAFWEFLKSEEAQSVFHYLGYGNVNPDN